jgi:hypothetical protein
MSHPTKRQALVRAARQGQEFTRIEPAKTTCERCQQEGIYAFPDGSPRPHLRPTRPGEELFSTIVPTRIDCTD